LSGINRNLNNDFTSAVDLSQNQKCIQPTKNKRHALGAIR